MIYKLQNLTYYPSNFKKKWKTSILLLKTNRDSTHELLIILMDGLSSQSCKKYETIYIIVRF